MAAGKSKIGRRLAEHLQVQFTDADQCIEQEFGCSIVDLFKERGEAEFRNAERIQIAKLLMGSPQVIAVGGGAFVNAQNREALNRSARTVWLDTPFELIECRLLRSSSRPLAMGKSGSELRALWNQRRHAYQEAQIHIDTSDADVELIVARIIRALR